MKRIALSLTIAMLAAAVAINAAFKQSSNMLIAQLSSENWDDLAPEGKEVDAIYGDFVLKNKYLTAVIAQPSRGRNANLVVLNVGGSLLDLTTTESGSDQLTAFFPCGRLFPYRSFKVLDTKSGPVDFTTKRYESSQSGTLVVTAQGTEIRPTVSIAYTLGADDKYLRISSKFINDTKQPVTIPLENEFRLDTRNEDVVQPANGTMDLFWVHDRHWGQAYGVEAIGFEAAVNSNSRASTLRYQSNDVNRKVTLQPGQAFSYVRRIIPGRDLPEVRAITAALHNRPIGKTAIQVKGRNGRPVQNARVTFKRGKEVWGSAQSDEDGLVKTQLPFGDISATVTALGIDITPNAAKSFSVKGDSSHVFDCKKWQPGVVTATVKDGHAKSIPFKIEFLAKEGTQQFTWGPDSGDFGIRGLWYAPDGTATLGIPPGDYQVVIAHGPEYDAKFQDITIKPNQAIELDTVLKRVVDSTGWVSSDFHSHSSPSGDNSGSQLGRVLNLVCDNIEFAPCTEHNRVDSYQPHIDRLKIGAFINSCTGIELTGNPLLLNHQNAFPIVYRPHTQDGGGPVVDTDVEKQVERLALWDNRSEKLLQVNHPDLGWLLRDKNGDQKADAGHEKILPHIDVMEIHPVPDILTLDPNITATPYKGNNRIINWLQFLNQGYRFVGVVNSDAHYNYHESGWVRNWIKSPTDDPAKIKTMDIVRASEAGAIIMSNGPFLSVKLGETGSSATVMPGQDVEALSGKISIDVKVQSPNWIDIDRVFVLVNGRIDERHHYRKSTHPNLFLNRTVKFEQQLQLSLKEDSHIIVVAGCEASTLGIIHGPRWGEHHPAAFHNPIFVDIDGGGFKANKDTLGHPLPVKFKKTN
jgi:hypothetical protein